MSQENSIVEIYENMAAAEDAIRMLDRGGFPMKQISIVGQDLQSEREVHGFITTGDVAKSGAGTGAWAGGLFGLLMGAAFIWMPGFGPLVVAGPFASALLGGVEGVVAGAASGGLLGVLIGWGVSKQHIIKYEEHLKGGKYLLIVHGSQEDIDKARNILAVENAAEVAVHA